MFSANGRNARHLVHQIVNRQGCRRKSPTQQTYATSATAPEVIFSGIQPTGVPHLGNYLGALRQWVKLQNSAPATTKLIYSVVDLHAITLPQDPAQLRQHKRECFAALLAIGIDPERSVLFSQSAVAAHAELMWILSCTASVGYLSRMTQWKSKIDVGPSASPFTGGGNKLKLGLFSYPVLQAADILVHRATHVPVGEDQSQHLEFARECATNFNAAYGRDGGILRAPETILSPAKRVMSLKDPAQKMSKSAISSKSRILLSDTPDQIAKKIRGAKTDDINSPSYDPVERPGVSNLLSLLSHFDAEGRSAAELGEMHSHLDMQSFKLLVSDAITETVAPISSKYHDILQQDGGKYIDYVAAQGAQKAQASANETMELVKEAIGF